MSKEFLTHAFSNAQGKYTWSLYFFKIDRRARKPYKMQKVRFISQQYLNDYVAELLSTISPVQIEKISDVQSYDGQNTKVSCDKLPLESDLISERWGDFNFAAANATDGKIDGKINGYVIKGECTSDDELPVITMVKVANPIIALKNKRTIVYKNTIDDELDLISDSFCRLYLTIDFVVMAQYLYAFNHSFETVFDIEKTLSKVKFAATEKILATNCFSDADGFRNLISRYKSPRTFITLNETRLQQLSIREGRERIAGLLQIPINDEGLLVISDMEKASHVIKYLCYKIFQEADTEDVFEASTVIKLQIAQS